MKAGQLAHIDRDRTKNEAKDLAFLCLLHHDEYDSQTSQSKGLTPRELRHYKGRLEADVEAGLVGRGVLRDRQFALRIAAIEIDDRSSWFQMAERAGEDYTLFSYSWAGMTGEGELPDDKVTDPILDVTLLNEGAPLVVSRVGVVAIRALSKPAGLSPPTRVAVFDELELKFQWLPGEPQWLVLPGPVGLDRGTPYRFTLRIRGYADAVPGNYGILRLVVQTSAGRLDSDGICLAC